VLTGLSGTDWVSAASSVGSALRLDLRIVRIDSADARDSYGDWQLLTQFPEDGCLLVRPDGHIAWRQDTPENAESALANALRSVLALPTV
jgi:2,4-dichlorophenol 6-monooxygenase